MSDAELMRRLGTRLVNPQEYVGNTKNGKLLFYRGSLGIGFSYLGHNEKGYRLEEEQSNRNNVTGTLMRS
jgi:hypothetical protein